VDENKSYGNDSLLGIGTSGHGSVLKGTVLRDLRGVKSGINR
jgi:hypothetical protein